MLDTVASRSTAPAPALLPAGLARLLLRPWFDALALPLVARWYFPLSRAWAAAELAGEDPARFWAAVPARPRNGRRLAAALAEAAARRTAYESAAELWEDRLFAAAPAPAEALLGAERGRAVAAHRWMVTR